MNYYKIKSKEDQQYNICLYHAKRYEKQFFNKGKNQSRLILDDKNAKVIIKDDIEYTLADDVYLGLLDDLLEYRKRLWETLK